MIFFIISILLLPAQFIYFRLDASRDRHVLMGKVYHARVSADAPSCREWQGFNKVRRRCEEDRFCLTRQSPEEAGDCLSQQERWLKQ